MPADREHLKSTLDELRQQLAEVSELDPTLRDQLNAALAEIQSALESKRPGDASAGHRASLADRLRQSAQHFEESHPSLAAAVGSVIDTLGRMGI